MNSRAVDAVLWMVCVLAGVAFGAWLAPIHPGVKGFVSWFFTCCGIGATVGYVVGPGWKRARGWFG